MSMTKWLRKSLPSMSADSRARYRASLAAALEAERNPMRRASYRDQIRLIDEHTRAADGGRGDAN